MNNFLIDFRNFANFYKEASWNFDVDHIESADQFGEN